MSHRDPLRSSRTSGKAHPVPRAAIWLLDLLGHPWEPPGQPTYSLNGVLRWTAASLRLPFPSLLAFGDLDDDGWLQAVPPVGTIQEALASPEVQPTVLLTDPDCAMELRAILPPGSVRILGVRTFEEALISGLGLLPLARDGALWADDLDVGWTAERLFTLTLESSMVPCGWPLLAALSVGLLRRTQDQPVAHWKLSLARDIARRHTGEIARINWPSSTILEALPSEVRWRVLAHVVQSAADGDISRVQEYATLTLDELERSDSLLSPGKAALRGALGRALAATGSYEQALSPLRHALKDWDRLDPPSASYALCELLRVLGILGLREQVFELGERVQTFLGTPKGSAAFVGLAWGRALHQCGEDALALDTLGLPQIFEQAPVHVLTSRLRWLAACQRRLGHREAAQATMARLEALGDSDQLHLARLDACLEAGQEENLDPHAQALLASAEGGEEAHHLLTLLAPGKDPRWAVRDLSVLLRLCREYRY
ncbi:MAG: hypothetical protein RMJ98_09365 [Myxococcales bacterium]|nr:hypothetical protein [Polyangiaceae bacterium]MDW8249495.1 hypothetical protein [Myxococcales bacterium]